MGESPLGPFSSRKKVRLPEVYQKIIGRRFQGGSWNKSSFVGIICNFPTSEC